MPNEETITSDAKGKMKLLIEKIDRLPTMPTVLAAVLQVAETPDSTTGDMEAVIIHDPSISAKIISFANSPYYGFSRKIVSLSNAIALIGFNTVKNITIGLSTFSCFRDPCSPLSSKVNDLYLHSFAVGLAAEQLALRSPVCDSEPAFLCGLLHDIGKMVMIQLLDLNYNNIMEIAHDKTASILDVEQKVLGFNHCHAGAWLVQSWGLPQILVDTIEHHHNPESQNSPLPPVICLADTFARKLAFGSGGDSIVPEIPSSLCESLHLTDQDLSETMERICLARDTIAEISRL